MTKNSHKPYVPQIQQVCFHPIVYVPLPFRHLVKPGNGSIIAAGSWCPGKNELQTIRYGCSVRLSTPNVLDGPFHRHNLQRSSARLRQIISSREFTALFGEARPHPQGERRNVFGGEDELKVAPKGVDKNHPSVLLRRSGRTSDSERGTGTSIYLNVDLSRSFTGRVNDPKLTNDR